MKQDMYECIGCHEAITNPICQDCLTRDIKSWLNKKHPAIVTLFNKFVSNSIRIKEGITCVSCGNKMTLCPYCFTEDVYYWVREVAPDLIESYLVHFNFDLEHKGYSSEP